MNDALFSFYKCNMKLTLALARCSRGSFFIIICNQIRVPTMSLYLIVIVIILIIK